MDCLHDDQHACQAPPPGVLFTVDVVDQVHDGNMQPGIPEASGFLRSQRHMKVDVANHDQPGGACFRLLTSASSLWVDVLC